MHDTASDLARGAPPVRPRGGRVAPALDLAITVPGLGDPATFRLVAERYTQPAPGEPAAGNLEGLARDIAVAKVWSVLEFLDRRGGGDHARADTVARIAGRLPSRLGGIAEGMNALA